MLLHDGKELDDNLGARADHHLTLALLLGIVDGVEAVIEDGSASHLDGIGKSVKIFFKSVDLSESGGDFSRADCESAALEVSV